MVNFGPLIAEIVWRVWGTSANFNGFRVLAALLYADVAQRKSTKLCTMSGRLLGTYTIYFSGLLPQRNFSRCKIHFASKSCVILYWQRYCTALEQWASAKLCGVVQGMELRNFRSSGATYIPRAAITLCIGPPHSSLLCLCDKVAVCSICLTCALVVHFVAR